MCNRVVHCLIRVNRTCWGCPPNSRGWANTDGRVARGERINMRQRGESTECAGIIYELIVTTDGALIGEYA